MVAGDSGDKDVIFVDMDWVTAEVELFSTTAVELFSTTAVDGASEVLGGAAVETTTK